MTKEAKLIQKITDIIFSDETLTGYQALGILESCKVPIMSVMTKEFEEE